MAYWLWGQAGNNQALLGPYNSSGDALEDFYKFDGIPELVELATNDQAKASQLMKYRRINSGESVTRALERIRHTIN